MENYMKVKIEVKYIPSELKAMYGYASRDKNGKVIIRGVQFDPFEEFKN